MATAATDRLTQLQDCFDQLATQMFACLRYINTHHAASPIPGQQFERHFGSVLGSTSTTSGAANSNANAHGGGTATPTAPSTPAAGGGANLSTPAAADNQNDPDTPPRPDSPAAFAAALRELSRDLVLKEQQIELLIRSLPGVGTSREEQEGRLKALEEELKEVEEEARGWAVVKQDLVDRVSDKIAVCYRPR